MKLATTFIPTPRVVDLMCKLFTEYRTLARTHETLIALRGELGRTEFERFEHDLVRLLNKRLACEAVRHLIIAAMERKRQLQHKPATRGIYQPAEV